MTVTEDHRTVGLDHVDVAGVLDIPDVGAFGTVDEVRRSPDRAKGAHRGVHPARDDLTGPVEERLVGAVPRRRHCSRSARSRAA